MQTINIDRSKTAAFTGHHKYFRDEAKQRYLNTANKATSNIILSSRYSDGCFLRRDDYMLEKCSLLIAYTMHKYPIADSQITIDVRADENSARFFLQ
jgi:hypothetical protein